MRWLWVATALFLVYPVFSFRYGDLIPMARRSQYLQQRTRWADLLAKDCPRYGVDKTITLPHLKPLQDIPNGEDFKISISVANERFVTPWITVVDRDAEHFLFSIEFTFIYSGDDLHELKWNTQYVSKPAESITLHYRWVLHPEKDTGAALNFLFLFGMAVTVFMATLVALDSKQLIKTELDSGGAYAPQPQGPTAPSMPAPQRSDSYSGLASGTRASPMRTASGTYSMGAASSYGGPGAASYPAYRPNAAAAAAFTPSTVAPAPALAPLQVHPPTYTSGPAMGPSLSFGPTSPGPSHLGLNKSD